MRKNIIRFFVMNMMTASLFGAVVIKGSDGNFTLERNGKPYFIKGGGGGGPKDLLAEVGGNSFRTWGAGTAQKELDIAQKNGLTATIRFWFGHQQHGFDYSNPAALEKQKEDVLKVVRRLKDHPALLMWALGNEMEIGNQHREEMWKHIDDVAKAVKAIDPNHPIMTVVAEIPDRNVREFNRFCPSVDILGINTYGGSASIGERYRKAGGVKPYIITEFGPPGQWEVGKTSFGCPREMTSTEKAKWYADVYKKTIEGERNKLCLGSYAFTWGHKVEATPTWYGLLLPDNTRLGATDALQECWTGKGPANRCPEISHIKVSRDDVKEAGGTLTAEATAKDPDGDKLTWKWVLVKEASTYAVTGTGEPTPPGFPEAIIKGQGTSRVEVKLPGGGKFRLYAYVFDGKGSGAYANIALQGTGAVAVESKQPQRLPFYVYANGAPETWYASGYMGNTGAIQMDLTHGKNPHSGDTCIKVSYNASDNWAGVLWQHPANDWGEQDGGFNLKGAGTLVFWARGEKGGEKVSFKVGSIQNAKYSDTVIAELKDIKLKTEWTRYRIPLDGRDLTRVKTGFGWVVANPGESITFYLDDIYYTAD
ncbi:MAG: hypothetical protein GX804_04065 [Lentisphaerae bacterium]|nr:hypothetical protein [Lentisphaerota bacterium]